MKNYLYTKLFPVADHTPVNFTVEYVSDGNTGSTLVDIPGPNDLPKIKDAGTKLIGNGHDLRDDFTIVSSIVRNPLDEVTQIKVNYKINGTLIQEHMNETEETREAVITLLLKFPVL